MWFSWYGGWKVLLFDETFLFPEGFMEFLFPKDRYILGMILICVMMCVAAFCFCVGFLVFLKVLILFFICSPRRPRPSHCIGRGNSRLLLEFNISYFQNISYSVPGRLYICLLNEFFEQILQGCFCVLVFIYLHSCIIIKK